MSEEVCFTLEGECYHRVQRFPKYIRSACGLLDSVIWNLHIEDRTHWSVARKRPCKRCFKGSVSDES